MSFLENPGVRFLIYILIPGVVGCVLLGWVFTRLGRRYDWRRRLTGR